MVSHLYRRGPWKRCNRRIPTFNIQQLHYTLKPTVDLCRALMWFSPGSERPTRKQTKKNSLTHTPPKYIFEVLEYAEHKQISDNVFHT